MSSFTSEIAKDQEKSICNKADSLLEIKIFTDGSGIDENIGAVVVMYRKGRAAPSKILMYHLGSTTDYTSFEVEVVGAIMGVWMIRTEHIAGWLPISILTDSQALIKRTQTHKL
jgi:ribonuclease HI